jgi:hypothetical protein
LKSGNAGSLYFGRSAIAGKIRAGVSFLKEAELRVANRVVNYDTVGQIGVAIFPIRDWSSVTFSYLASIATVRVQRQERLALITYGKE